MTNIQLLTIIYFGLLVVVSIIALTVYGVDKNLAKAGKNRIKESVLLGVSAFGGGFGSLIGRILFRHKTNKIYFSMTIYTSCIVQAVVGALLLYFTVV
ncbi:MAG: DUF1294 domain-containing protein [Clostridia bacterium]|nr:DUF1294 domain-containing protein [Clostridia bacterium]